MAGGSPAGAARRRSLDDESDDCAIHLGTDAVDFVVLNTAPLSLAGRIREHRLLEQRFAPVQRVVERTLHLAIEASMDLADQLVADRRLPMPETAAGALAALGSACVLSASLAQALARMVAVRNILVHDYARLDPAIVLRVLREDVDDIGAFRDVVVSLR